MPWCMQSTYSVGGIKDSQILGIPPMKKWSVNLLPLLLGWPWWLAPSITHSRNDKLGSRRLGHKKLLPEAPGTLALETVSPQVTSLPPLRLQTPEKPMLTAWRGHMERGTGLAPAGPATPAEAPDRWATQPPGGSSPSQHGPVWARKPRQEPPSEPSQTTELGEKMPCSFKLLSVGWLVTQQWITDTVRRCVARELDVARVSCYGYGDTHTPAWSKLIRRASLLNQSHSKVLSWSGKNRVHFTFGSRTVHQSFPTITDPTGIRGRSNYKPL